MPKSWICSIIVLTLCGCMQSLEDQTKKSDTFIVGKKTQDIGKFDPNANNKVSDSKVEITNAATGALEAYGPIMEQLSKGQIKQAVDLYHAENDRYPKDYDEFMALIVKPNQIKLPVLPGGKKYQYDEANHTLVVIEAPTEENTNK